MSRRILAVCLDCGDTLVDEGSEIKDANGVTLHAQLIPGARELLEQLCARGYKIALIADGPVATFRNLFAQHDLAPFFTALAISEEVGSEKPHPRIFHHALAGLNIVPQQYPRVVMIGNNLERDIKGANALGLISVWLDWAPRRSKTPKDQTEKPQYTIKMPLEALALLDALERLCCQ